jgi:hypothetical protein
MCTRGAAGLLGAVFDPVAAVAAPAPMATTALVPRIDSRYLRLRIQILPSGAWAKDLTAPV